MVGCAIIAALGALVAFIGLRGTGVVTPDSEPASNDSA
jgi:hypothetical protein